MSTDTATLVVTERTIVGKGVNRLRQDGLVPGVVYEKGKDSTHIMAEYNPLAKVNSMVGKHKPVELKIGQHTKLTMIKDVDFDPVKHRIRHIAFHAINRNETVEADMPITLVGEIPAEKAGLSVIHVGTSVTIEALPSDLVDVIEIDASKLAAVGDHLTVADIVPPKGIKILTEPEHVLATVEEPRSLAAEAAAEAAEAAEQSAAEVPAEHGEGQPEDQSASS